jgi:type II secretory ATPase GspE/PulE/Tfp pilus assembly ATPase PilB-like protein
MKTEPFLISSTLNIILAQRLVRKLCDEKEKYTLGVTELERLKKYCDPSRILEVLKEEKIAKPKDRLENVTFYRPRPSGECPEGYSGRIGIFEVLLISESIRRLISEEATSEEVQSQALKEGMRTMIEDGFIKAAQGITSIEEVLRVIIE